MTFAGSTYDPQSRMCTYTQSYCQANGLCFDQGSRSCFLPTKAMTAVSAFFGQEGPREWIRVHGCSFPSSPADQGKFILDLLPFGMFFTSTGRTFLAEIFSSSSHWNDSIRKYFEEPANIAMFIGLAGPIAAGAVASTVGVVAEAGLIGAEAATFAAEAATGVGIILMVGSIVTIVGLMMYQESVQFVATKKLAPQDIAAEYSSHGWSRDNAFQYIRDESNNLTPSLSTLMEGWVTKPLPVPSKTGSGQPAANVGDLDGVTSQQFFQNYDPRWYAKSLPGTDKVAQGLTTAVNFLSGGTANATPDSPVADWLNNCNQNPANKGGLAQCPVYNYCVKNATPMIRVGSTADNNIMWCLPEQPPVSYANANIGPLASVPCMTVTSGTAQILNAYSVVISDVYPVSNIGYIIPGMNFPMSAVPDGTPGVMGTITATTVPQNISQPWTFTVQASTPQFFKSPLTLGAFTLTVPSGTRVPTASLASALLSPAALTITSGTIQGTTSKTFQAYESFQVKLVFTGGPLIPGTTIPLTLFHGASGGTANIQSVASDPTMCLVQFTQAQTLTDLTLGSGTVNVPPTQTIKVTNAVFTSGYVIQGMSVPLNVLNLPAGSTTAYVSSVSSPSVFTVTLGSAQAVSSPSAQAGQLTFSTTAVCSAGTVVAGKGVTLVSVTNATITGGYIVTGMSVPLGMFAGASGGTATIYTVTDQTSFQVKFSQTQNITGFAPGSWSITWVPGVNAGTEIHILDSNTAMLRKIKLMPNAYLVPGMTFQTSQVSGTITAVTTPCGPFAACTISYTALKPFVMPMLTSTAASLSMSTDTSVSTTLTSVTTTTTDPTQATKVVVLTTDGTQYLCANMQVPTSLFKGFTPTTYIPPGAGYNGSQITITSPDGTFANLQVTFTFSDEINITSPIVTVPTTFEVSRGFIGAFTTFNVTLTSGQIQKTGQKTAKLVNFTINQFITETLTRDNGYSQSWVALLPANFIFGYYTPSSITSSTLSPDTTAYISSVLSPTKYVVTLSRYQIITGVGTLPATLTYAVTSQTNTLKNRMWTDGVDPNAPQYVYNAQNKGNSFQYGPVNPYPAGSGQNSPELRWFYQLVYSKSIFTPDPVTGIITNQNMWNTAFLQNHFSDTTIGQIRMSACQSSFATCYANNTLQNFDPKCWGYISASMSNYTFMNMTRVSLDTFNQTGKGCAAGQVYNMVTKTCQAPLAITAPSGGLTPPTGLPINYGLLAIPVPVSGVSNDPFVRAITNPVYGALITTGMLIGLYALYRLLGFALRKILQRLAQKVATSAAQAAVKAAAEAAAKAVATAAGTAVEAAAGAAVGAAVDAAEEAVEQAIYCAISAIFGIQGDGCPPLPIIDGGGGDDGGDRGGDGGGGGGGGGSGPSVQTCNNAPPNAQAVNPVVTGNQQCQYVCLPTYIDVKDPQGNMFCCPPITNGTPVYSSLSGGSCAAQCNTKFTSVVTPCSSLPAGALCPDKRSNMYMTCCPSDPNGTTTATYTIDSYGRVTPACTLTCTPGTNYVLQKSTNTCIRIEIDNSASRRAEASLRNSVVLRDPGAFPKPPEIRVSPTVYEATLRNKVSFTETPLKLKEVVISPMRSVLTLSALKETALETPFTTCPANEYLRNGQCIQCPISKYSPAASTSCTTCPNNSVLNSTRTGCTCTSTLTNGSYTYDSAANTCAPGCNPGYTLTNGTTCTLTDCVKAGGTAFAYTTITPTWSATSTYAAQATVSYTQGTAPCQIDPSVDAQNPSPFYYTLGTSSIPSYVTSVSSNAKTAVITTAPGVMCSNGKYSSLSGSTYTCTQCPTCPNVTNATSVLSGCGGTSAGTCTVACIQNYYASSTTNAGIVSACTACPSGSTSSAGSSTCSCSAGYSQSGSGSSLSCTQCSAGYYAAAGASQCTACPSGSTSSAGSSTCSCSAGYSQSGSGSSLSCSQCSAGSYSAAGASSCSQCSAGSYSAAGASQCTACDTGTYQDQTGQTSCKTCQTCPKTNVANATNVLSGCGNTSPGTCTIQCNSGYYASGMSSGIVTACSPVTQSCPASTSSYTVTTITETSTADKQCTYTCNAGYAGGSITVPATSNTRPTCTQCSAGYYAAAGASSCTACPANSTSSAGSSTCTCSGGYSQSGSGSSLSCSQCSAGYYVAAGASQCEQCSAGLTYSAAGASSCTACLYPVNPFDYVTAACTTTADTQITKRTAFPCTSGTQYLSGFSRGSSSAVGSAGTCTNYASCPSSSDSTMVSTIAGTPFTDRQCTYACNAGYFGGSLTVTATSTTRLTCTACPYATFSSSTGSNSCTPCTACAAVPSNATRTGTTSCTRTSDSVCGTVQCDNGYYASSVDANGNATACTACPTCSTITNGTVSLSGCGGRSPGTCVVSCNQNFYFSRGTGLFGAPSCKACPAGSTSSAGATTCTCSAGYSQSGSGSSLSCSQCSAGYYAAAGASSCSQCSAGSYSAAGASSCSQCSAGSYSMSAGASSCSQCPPGSYQDTQGQTACKSCPVGTYNPSTGSAASSACLQCPQGSYQDAQGQAACTSCPIGTYQDTQGQSGCKQCPAGSYQDTTGSLGCASCPTNTVSPWGASSCINYYAVPSSVTCVSTYTVDTGLYGAGNGSHTVYNFSSYGTNPVTCNYTYSTTISYNAGRTGAIGYVSGGSGTASDSTKVQGVSCPSGYSPSGTQCVYTADPSVRAAGGGLPNLSVGTITTSTQLVAPSAVPPAPPSATPPAPPPAPPSANPTG